MTLLVTSQRNLIQIGLSKEKGSQKDLGSILEEAKEELGDKLGG